MIPSFWNETLTDALEQTASGRPTPSGGSVAAMSAAFGLGLVVMALEISARRAQPSQSEEIACLIAEARQRMERLKACAEKDMAAVRRYMEAAALPKRTAEEQEARTAAVAEVLTAATESLFHAAEEIAAAIEIGIAAIPPTRRHVITDLGAGLILLEGARNAVLLNLDMNLTNLPDSERKRLFLERRTEAARIGLEAEKARLLIHARIANPSPR
jgi:formiminotetrahydrofolate cyclodeaminase